MKGLVGAILLLSAGVSVGQDYSTSCPDQWVKWKNYCYLFANTLKVNWDTAHTECSTRHAHLLRIDSVDEYIFVRQQYEQHPSDGYWTSLNDLPLNEPLNTTKGTHVWLWGNDGHPLKEIVDSNWDKEPDNSERTDCVQVSTQAALTVEDCNNKHGYMCQIATASDSSCPPGNWYSGPPDDSMCYYVSNVTNWQELLTWDQARQKCENWAPFTNTPTSKAKMLTIPTLDMTNYLAANLPYYGRANPNQVYWTGLNDKQNEGTFAWASNPNVQFKETAIKWRQEPNNLGGHENCGVLMAGGYWSDWNCDAETNYICRMALPNAPQEWSMGCGQWTRAGQKCVFVYTNPLSSWDDARAFCQAESGDLLKFDNEDDKMWLRMQAPTIFSALTYWIGLNDKKEENTFLWADGSWAPGYLLDWDSEPQNWNRRTGQEEDCAVMDYSGDFIDVPCSGHKAGVLCEEATTSCATGWTSHGSNCYFADDSRWRLKSEAVSLCHDKSATGNGRLFDLNTKDEKDFLVQLVSGKAITFFWSDLVDSVLEGDWHWAHWDPNGDDTSAVQQLATWIQEPNNYHNNEDCVTVDINGMLNDADCTKKSGFICQRSLNAGEASRWSVSAALLPLLSVAYRWL